MLLKSKKEEVWIRVDGSGVKELEKLGLLARVPELLRLNLISAGPDFSVEDLNKWLYITKSGRFTVYESFEEAEADLA